MSFSSFDQACRLRRFGQELVFVSGSGSAPPAYELVETHSGYSAERFVAALGRERGNLRELERLANSSLLGKSAAASGEAAIVQFVAGQWARGEYKLYSEPRPAGPGPKEEPVVEETGPVYNTIREKSFFSVRLVADATDEPISGVKLIAEFPNRSKKEATTDRGGRIDVDFEGYGPVTLTSSIKGAKRDEALVYVRTAATPSHNAKDLGEAELNGAPIVSTVEYRVKTGDTLDAIATGYGITRDDLTMFNFGTTDPKDVDKRLRSDVGCKRNQRTKRVELSSDDKPGIIYVPKPLRLPGLSLNTLHIVRVTMACQHIRLRIASHQGRPRQNAPYHLTLSDGRNLEGRTNAEGYLDAFECLTAQSGTLHVGDNVYELTLVESVTREAPHVQSMLNAAGLEAGPLDGDIGQQTRSALFAFQRALGIEPTGTPDEQTIRLLRERNGLPADG